MDDLLDSLHAKCKVLCNVHGARWDTVPSNWYQMDGLQRQRPHKHKLLKDKQT